MFILRIFALLMSLAVHSLSAELYNLARVKDAVQEYYEGDGYKQDLDKIVKVVCAQFAQPALHNKQVIIFDVDEVALSMYNWFKERDFGMTSEFYYPGLRVKHFPAVPQIKVLYDYFKNLGYTIIFLTGRYDEVYESTRINLIAEGYTEFEYLITRSSEEDLPVGVFKELARLKLVEQGYEIMCCIDDNSSCLQGKHVGYTVKIPNYLY